MSSGEGSKAPPSSPPTKLSPKPRTNPGAPVPAQRGAPEGTGPTAKPRAKKGERSRPNKAPGTHSSRRGRTKGAFGDAEATRPLPAPGGQSAATAVSALARSRDLAHRSPRDPAPGTPHGPPSAPSLGGVPHRPFPNAPTSAGSQQWALPRRSLRPRRPCQAGGAGARGAAAPARPPASHRPHAARRPLGK